MAVDIEKVKSRKEDERVKETFFITNGGGEEK